MAVEKPFHWGTSPKCQAFGAGGPSFLTNVGATLLFFGTVVCSSLSDSLVSRFPSTLPLTELGRLLIIPDGVCGGVVHGRPLKDGFVAATLGTLPSIGVGLLLTIWDDCVATDEVELDLVGLGGGKGLGEAEGASTGVDCFSKDGGAEAAVGVGIGVGCAEEDVDIGAGDG